LHNYNADAVDLSSKTCNFKPHFWKWWYNFWHRVSLVFCMLFAKEFYLKHQKTRL